MNKRRFRLIRRRRPPILGEQSGSAVTEFCFSLSLLLPIVGSTMALAYLCFAKIWLSHAGYEAMICVAAKTAKSQCEQRLRNQVQNGLPVGSLKHFNLQISSHGVTSELSFEVADKLKMGGRQSLHLPLLGGSK